MKFQTTEVYSPIEEYVALFGDRIYQNSFRNQLILAFMNLVDPNTRKVYESTKSSIRVDNVANLLSFYGHGTVIETARFDEKSDKSYWLFLSLRSSLAQIQMEETEEDTSKFYRRDLPNFGSVVDKVIFEDEEVCKYLLPNTPSIQIGSKRVKVPFHRYIMTSLDQPWDVFFIYQLPYPNFIESPMHIINNMEILGFLTHTYSLHRNKWRVERGVVLKRKMWGTGCAKSSWHFSKLLVDMFGMTLESSVHVDNIRSNQNALSFYGKYYERRGDYYIYRYNSAQTDSEF